MLTKACARACESCISLLSLYWHFLFKKLSCWYLQLTQDGGAAQPAASSREGALEAAQEQIEDVVLHSTNQFYKWHSELEAAFASETEEKYKQYAAELQGRLDSCAEILRKASSLLWHNLCRSADTMPYREVSGLACRWMLSCITLQSCSHSITKSATRAER